MRLMIRRLQGAISEMIGSDDEETFEIEFHAATLITIAAQDMVIFAHLLDGCTVAGTGAKIANYSGRDIAKEINAVKILEGADPRLDLSSRFMEAGERIAEAASFGVGAGPAFS
ncbi:hypothetical protein AAE478_003565 [Parahypoxylon ruwenzoriense]